MKLKLVELSRGRLGKLGDCRASGQEAGRGCSERGARKRRVEDAACDSKVVLAVEGVPPCWTWGQFAVILPPTPLLSGWSAPFKQQPVSKVNFSYKSKVRG